MNGFTLSNLGDDAVPGSPPLRGAFSPASWLTQIDRSRSQDRKDKGRSPQPSGDLRSPLLASLTEDGIGLEGAVACYLDLIHPHFRRVEDRNYFSWVPGAPSDAATLGDLLVTLDNAYAGSVADAEGPVAAEQAAIAVLATLAGYPATAEGTFVSGGTAGNIAALTVAREAWRRRKPAFGGTRGVILCSEAVHSSVFLAAHVIDCEVVTISVDDSDRIDGDSVRQVLAGMRSEDRGRVCAVVGSAGTTNSGVIDDLVGIGLLARDEVLWFHVDGAYGGAALFGERAKGALEGMALADSFIVDPHKWLFSPYDSCAVVYREPERVAGVFRQEADYLSAQPSSRGTDPADLAPHLSRRARGLPFWWTLAVYGTRQVGQAVDASIDLAQRIAEQIRASDCLDLLVDPELSVVLFTRQGWDHEDYLTWSTNWEGEGRGLVVPTSWRGKPALRLCVVNPETTLSDLEAVLASVESSPR